MSLTVRSLRKILASALGRSEVHVGAHLAALAQERLLPSADDAEIDASHLVTIVLALLTNEPAERVAAGVRHLTSFRSTGACARLVDVLADELEGRRDGMRAPSSLLQIWRRVAPEGEFLVFETHRREEGGAPLIRGAYFEPPSMLRSSTVAAPLTCATELTLSWLLVEHLAHELGPRVTEQPDVLIGETPLSADAAVARAN